MQGVPPERNRFLRNEMPECQEKELLVANWERKRLFDLLTTLA